MTQTTTRPVVPPSYELPESQRGQVVPVLDFGSQYVQLIARRVRDAGVFSVLVPPDISVDDLRAMQPRGIILSGGPASVNDADAPRCDERLFELGVPVLGICYGMQIGCQLLGATVRSAPAREFGRASLHILESDPLLRGVPEHTTVWMSHGDQVAVEGEAAKKFIRLAETPTCPFAAVRHTEQPFIGVQFHPEVTHTPHGVDLISNFLFQICGCTGTWRMTDFLETQIDEIRRRVGEDRVVCGLSGGVDSAVTAALLAKAIGRQLTCVFVDNGLLRNNERELVETTFRDHFDVDLRVVDAADQFLSDLAGVEDPQEKRRRIGHRFIEVFKQVVARLSEPWTSIRLSEPEDQHRLGEPMKPTQVGDLCHPESQVGDLCHSESQVGDLCHPESQVGDLCHRVTGLGINRTLIDWPADRPTPLMKVDGFIGRDPFPAGAESPADISGYIRNLPHLELPGATYFVTWRTKEGQRLSEMEREIVLQALCHWHGERIEVFAACVMDDHVHALIRPIGNCKLKDVTGGIKKFAAREVNARRGTSGSLWQDERFDHIIRDEVWLTKFFYYILRNPVEAGLASRPSAYRWTVIHTGVRSGKGEAVWASGSDSASARRADETITGQRPVPPETAVKYLAQGTLYPDVIESGQGYAGQSANIKLHHNVGGLPEQLGFELIEPLRSLFKDEVRKLGAVLGLPEQMVWRHPFPGPGLAVRVLGEVTRPKLDLLRQADEILLEEIVANNLYRRTAQVFAVLLPVKAVGVMGDGRTYESVVAIRAVESQDFMTADWARIPYDVLATISNRVINEVRGVNRVVYDISSKPPATIEWE